MTKSMQTPSEKSKKSNLKSPKHILTDIEGTTTSISFVHTILFGYIKDNLKTFLDSHSNDEQIQIHFQSLQTQSMEDAQQGLIETPVSIKDMQSIQEYIEWQMSRDLKRSCLKEFQGFMWKSAYESGEIQGHVFEDVVDAFKYFKNELKTPISIYSSGSVNAQKLLFGFSLYGDLLEYIHSHFDTVNAGSKLEASSYIKIASELKLNPNQILFLTDNIKEVEAAQEAGMQVYLLNRPGNTLVSDSEICRLNVEIIQDFSKLLTFSDQECPIYRVQEK